jgi:nicotinamide-nucleotide amidase
MDVEFEKLIAIVRPYMFGIDEDSLEVIIGNLLKSKNKTVCTAESCTGGYVSHLITKVAGSSEYYVGSTITYSYPSKTKLLNVPADLLERRGAVSEEVATIMAQEAMKMLGADYSISTTDKPVGTVWIGIGSKSGVTAKKFQLGGDRSRNIEMTAIYALNMLRKVLIEEN